MQKLMIPYGEHPSQYGILRLPEGTGPFPVAVMIHGGNWQMMYGLECIELAAQDLAKRGLATWNIEYRRVGERGGGWPGTFVDAAAAVRFLRPLAKKYPLDLKRVVLLGHSAGGQLAAMLMGTDWQAIDPALPARLVGAALPISGVFEIEPLLPTTIGRGLNLTAAEARALSPRWQAAAPGELHCVVGGAESDEFRRQTRDFAAAWGGTAEELPGANHFTVLDPFPDPAHPLVAHAAAMAGRLAPG